MRAWIAAAWDALRTSLWFIPGLLAVGGALVAVVTIWIDLNVSFQGTFSSWISFASADSAREMLSTIVGALITALSLVFSMTIVALTLAAAQLGPRLLRNFMRDPSNQIVIGVLAATLLYCLIALHAVGRYEALSKLPQITALVAMTLTVLSLGILIFFVHHVADFIQAPRVIATVAHELDVAMSAHFEEADASVEDLEKTDSNEQAFVTRSSHANYLDGIDETGLIALACKYDVVFEMLHRQGDFVVKGAPLFRVHGKIKDKNELRKELDNKVIFGIRRTATQDVEFVVQELVEVAIRALSPSINDAFTAITCVDRLGNFMCQLAQRKMPERQRYDENGRVRLILDQTDFAGICNTAFAPIRQMAEKHPAVTIRMLEAIETIVGFTRTEEQRQALWWHACMLREHTVNFHQRSDREDTYRRFERIRVTLGKKGC